MVGLSLKRWQIVTILKLSNGHEHLTDKSALYTLNTCPQDPNFLPFSSTTSRFQDTKLSNIRSAPNDPRLALPVNCQKYPVYTNYLQPRPKLHSFALRWLLYEIIAVFGFTVWYNVEPEIYRKQSLKIGNSTFQKSKRIPL